MEKLSSSLFQRTYHQLAEPVQVTVYGRVIGTWTPVKSRQRSPAETAFREVVRRQVDELVPEEPLVRPFSKAQQAGRR